MTFHNAGYETSAEIYEDDCSYRTFQRQVGGVWCVWKGLGEKRGWILLRRLRGEETTFYAFRHSNDRLSGQRGVSDLLPEQQNLLEKLKPVLKDAGWLEYSEHRDRHAPPQRPEQNPTPTFPFTSHLHLSLQCLLTRHSRDAANAPSRVRGTADRDGTTTAGFKELFSLCGNQGFVTRNHETAVIKKEKAQNKDQHLQWWSSASVPLSNDATVQSQISHSQRVGF